MNEETDGRTNRPTDCATVSGANEYVKTHIIIHKLIDISFSLKDYFLKLFAEVFHLSFFPSSLSPIVSFAPNEMYLRGNENN